MNGDFIDQNIVEDPTTPQSVNPFLSLISQIGILQALLFFTL